MKRYLFAAVLVLAVGVLALFAYLENVPVQPSQFETAAADPGISSFTSYYPARVTEVTKDETLEAGSHYGMLVSQTFKARILAGSEKDSEVEVENNNSTGGLGLKVSVGEKIVLGRLEGSGAGNYVLLDKYRLFPLAFILGLFIALALLLGRMRGVAALAGLAFSIFLLTNFIAPGILSGKSAILVSATGAGMIVLVSIFLGRGVNERSALATLSTFISLGIAAGLAYWLVDWAKLFGLGTQSAFYLQSGFFGGLDMQGLLFAGILIGTLGILDDVTTAQTAAVGEIHLANPGLGFAELFARGSVVGREHIGSLINTLVLAYAGASFPLFLLFTLVKGQPLWVVVNSEYIAEEVLRALIGSIALMLAVPITCVLASYYFSHYRKK